MRLFFTEIVAFVAVGFAVVVLVASNGLVIPTWEPTGGPARERYCHDRALMVLNGSPVRGKAWLCMDGEGVEMIAVAEHLVPRRVYTAWMFYANDPSRCRATPCEARGSDDPDGHWVQARIDGAVSDATGVTRLASTYRGLRFAQGSQVLLALVDGGEPKADVIADRARRILLPPIHLLEQATVSSTTDGRAPDKRAGEVVAHTLFTVLRHDD